MCENEGLCFIFSIQVRLPPEHEQSPVQAAMYKFNGIKKALLIQSPPICV